MRSLRLTGTSSLSERDSPNPSPGPGEVLIRVRAAGITPSEVLWYPTTHTRTGDSRQDAILSHEFSGEVVAIGPGVPEVRPGDEVYGMNDWFADGALAEFCITRPEWIAAKPARISHTDAASVPIGALTAWQGLFDRANLQPGERVLIHGGAGAVGIWAVQMAHAAGAHVITTVSQRNFDSVRALGADEVIDYHAGPFEQQSREIDVVFDTAGGDTLRRSWSVLRPGGRLVTVAASAEAAPDEREKAAFFIVESRREQLTVIADRLARGELRPVVDAVVPWTQASEALAGRAGKLGRGKVVVTI